MRSSQLAVSGLAGLVFGSLTYAIGLGHVASIIAAFLGGAIATAWSDRRKGDVA